MDPSIVKDGHILGAADGQNELNCQPMEVSVGTWFLSKTCPRRGDGRGELGQLISLAM